MGKIKGSSKVCAFCTKCSSEVHISSGSGNKTLRSFYSEFLVNISDLEVNNDNCTNKRGKPGKSKKVKKVGTSDVPDKWTVCRKCLPNVQLALQAKEKVNMVESQVRKIQLELLEELEHLLVEMEGMHGHLKNIERSVMTAKSVEDSRKPVERSSLRKQKENDKFIEIFQEKLIKALQDIQLFQVETSRKLLKNPETTLIPLQSGQGAESSTENCNPFVKTELADFTIDHDDSLDNLSNFDGSSHDNYFIDDDCEMTSDSVPPQIKLEDKSNPALETQDILSLSSSDDDQDQHSADSDFDPDNQSYPSTSSSVKGMSKFRKNFIARIRKRHTISTSNTLPKDTSDPRRPFHIKYTQNPNKFFLEDFEILVLDSPEILQCASCPFQVKNPPHIPRKANHPEDQMFEHILSKHLLLYSCTICCKSFETLYTLKSHKFTHLEPNLKPMVPCPICEKPISASSSNNLKGHQWTHLNFEEKRDPKNAHLMPTKIRQYFVEGKKNECATCGKDFINRSHLKHHERTHLSMEDRQEDKVICPICGRGILKPSFRAHQNLCGKEREFKKKVSCPVCEVKVKNNKWLDIHAGECHPGEKIFRCGVCGKMFGSMAYLRNHMESHDKEKKYVCEGCGLGYQQKRNLKRHKVGCRGFLKREIN